MFKNWVLCLFAAISCKILSIEGIPGALIEFQIEPFPEKFIFGVRGETDVQQARDILSGKEVKNIHVLGQVKRIQPQDANFNPDYNFYLDPENIHFFDSADAGLRDNYKCDMSIKDIQNCQNNCTYFDSGSFIWCPYGSRLTREVTDLHVKGGIDETFSSKINRQ